MSDKEKERLADSVEESASHPGDVLQSNFTKSRFELQKYTTAELVDALKWKDGVVNTIVVPPHEKVEILTEGPAIVLVVIN